MFIFNQQPGAKLDIRCPKKSLLCLENSFFIKDFSSQSQTFTLFPQAERVNSTDHVPSEYQHTDLKTFVIEEM